MSEARLILHGRVSPASLALVRAGLPHSWPVSAHCFFALYAEDDVQLGTEFTSVFLNEMPASLEHTRALLRAVTQQFARPFEVVPRGWKTICLIDFPEGLPGVIERLPVVDAWDSPPLVTLETRGFAERTR